MPQPRKCRSPIPSRIQKTRTAPLAWFYLSYADTTSFRGAVILEAHNFLDATRRARANKLSPGGEVIGDELPLNEMRRIPEDLRNRLLSEVEVLTLLDGRRAYE